ncbi:hypothetical protein NOR_04024 [Metarhizium rileyi]|uniref:Uncharacterized protein n=1 Tax=Metarhizium rileyi (strain RCEF 4871) TaxID=1649241 RepID=A0A167ER30_METRR|nr:hypothetical protein NOR_04024 [Metarhizium rileyi RCEF 4871]
MMTWWKRRRKHTRRAKEAQSRRRADESGPAKDDVPGTQSEADLAPGQMTPGQQSTLSAVPERRASPWDPTH